MNNVFGFIKELFSQPTWVVVWVNALVVVNLASAFYYEFVLSQAIFWVFIVQAIVMVVLYSRYGFEKILGMAHFLWPFILVYIVINIGSYSGSYFYYLVVLSIFITISLLFDVYDMVIYAKQRKV
ncbi:hypothetical protein [Marinobacter sp.]|uniref:hypothetical protein n=1 Tax=Marinobacter sp. TaxID=50741 RepID=UPI003BAB2F2B